MSVKPILFKSDMVRAILDGRKTVTRRLIKKLPPGTYRVDEINENQFEAVYGIILEGTCIDMGKEIKPPYRIGDVLYVREAYATETTKDGALEYVYKASDTYPFGDHKNITRWKPAVRMPKEAARIWLKVTNVNIERLNDIALHDCYREGADISKGFNDFIRIWDSTIKKTDIGLYDWRSNPFVWVIEFERCEKPEEAI
jgi:hypothetical protein